MASTVDVDGEDPPFRVRLKANGGGTVGEAVQLSSIGESWERYKELTTDSGEQGPNWPVREDGSDSIKRAPLRNHP